MLMFTMLIIIVNINLEVTFHVFKALIITNLHHAPKLPRPHSLAQGPTQTNEHLVWGWAMQGFGAKVWTESC